MLRIVLSELNIKAWNVITIITSLGTRVKFGPFRQFCVQEFSADLQLHELVLKK